MLGAQELMLCPRERRLQEEARARYVAQAEALDEALLSAQGELAALALPVNVRPRAPLAPFTSSIST